LASDSKSSSEKKPGITLCGNIFEESSGLGVERYSYEILNGLKKNGIDAKTIGCSKDFERKMKFSLKFFLYHPLKVLFTRPKSMLYHFTMQHLSLSAYLAKRILRRKVVITVHDLQHHLLNKEWVRWLFDKAIKLAVFSSDLILTDSSMVKKDIEERYGINGNKIRVCLLGVDSKFRKIPKEKNDVFTIGYIGRFADYKNVKFIIHSFSKFEKQYPDRSRLVLYGRGEERDSCIRLAKDLGICNIEFPGFADENDLVNIYNSFDVFIFPSSYEGFGLPIIEAQRCGVPVIVKEGAHVPDEVTCFCLKAKDEDHAARLLSKLHSEGFKFTPEHKAYLEKFSWDKCVDSTIAAYQSLLETG